MCSLCTRRHHALLHSAAESRAQLEKFAESHRAKSSGLLDEEDVLTRASNAVLDLIEAGQLEQAEATARALLDSFPQVHDGYTRLGKVFEARGNRRQAAHWYRRSVEFMRAHPNQHDPEFIDAIEGESSDSKNEDLCPRASAANGSDN